MKKAGEESPAVETQFSTPVTMNEYLAFVKQNVRQKTRGGRLGSTNSNKPRKFPGLLES
jgi:hypothetical protein